MRIPNILTATATAAILTAASLAAPATAQEAGGAANAVLMNADGKTVGSVEVTETPNGLLVQLDATGLPAGEHGFHVHTTGQCDAPDFKSAGGHFNPGDKKHGFLVQGGPHPGDMPNITVGEDGTAQVEVFLRDASLSGENALLDDDGAAFMIHDGADDYETDPAGDAGNRIACGVVEQST